MAGGRVIDRAVLVACAAAVTLAAWAWLLQPHHYHHLSFQLYLPVLVMWQAMMVAMMTPAVMPWLVAFAKFSGRSSGVAAFAGGYFVVWLGYSAVGAALQIALGERLPARAGGIVLIAAGLIYFTPLTRACLKHCRNPLTYFLERWKNGPRGGFRIGLTHGAYCAGCCWALMLTGFAMGVMNMVWMALLTVLIVVEKVAPHGEKIGAAAAIGMAIWGVVVLI